VPFLKGFAQFWYDFLIGDDWKIAAAVTVTLCLGAVVLLTTSPPSQILTVALAVALMGAFSAALALDVRRSSLRSPTPAVMTQSGPHAVNPQDEGSQS
jgi:hypothetical protein